MTGGRVGIVLAAAAAVLVVATACGAGNRSCAEPDVRTVPGWVGYLAAHPGDVAYVIDDGRGTRIEHRADEVQPVASAGKALHAVAYARAVALGTVSPDEPVRVGDWERWRLLGNESSHVQSLDYLGIPRAGDHAADPARIVTLDQLADVMMIFSDDASPDYLRARLGDRALLEAARDVGWRDPELLAVTGSGVSLYTPELVPPATDLRARRAAEWKLGQRCASDPVFRADVDARGVGPGVEARWADGAPGGPRGTSPGCGRRSAVARSPGPTVPVPSSSRARAAHRASSGAAPRVGPCSACSPAASRSAVRTGRWLRPSCWCDA